MSFCFQHDASRIHPSTPWTRSVHRAVMFLHRVSSCGGSEWGWQGGGRHTGVKCDRLGAAISRSPRHRNGFQSHWSMRDRVSRRGEEGRFGEGRDGGVWWGRVGWGTGCAHGERARCASSATVLICSIHTPFGPRVISQRAIRSALKYDLLTSCGGGESQRGEQGLVRSARKNISKRSVLASHSTPKQSISRFSKIVSLRVLAWTVFGSFVCKRLRYRSKANTRLRNGNITEMRPCLDLP